jgi:hypothetical protein
MKTKTGIELIAEERNRQVEEEGYTLEHDDEHEDGEIAKAAACYAAPEPIYEKRETAVGTLIADPFPWGHWVSGRSVEDRDSFVPHTTYMVKQNKSRLRQLTIAGALIAAEIDRIQRSKT